ncbi:hypothetical protein KAR91_14505 [Candidatus Pacearchaeota archaeon]|nr:hypothetical protein [Candidatus Pacearchaeota archaeon]
MMYGNFSTGSGFGGLWYGLHGLVCLAFLIGLILVLVWAIKTLKKDQLLSWGAGLLIAATLLWLLGMASGGLGFRSHMYSRGYNYGTPGMWECMQDEECHEEIEEFMEQRMGIR